MARDFSASELTDIRRSLTTRLDEPHVSPLVSFADAIGKERGLPTGTLPYPDPDGGGVNARVLFLLASPSPSSRRETGGSGLLTIYNDDPISARQRAAARETRLQRSRTLHWNAVSWPVDDAAVHCSEGATSTIALLTLLGDLRLVVTLGSIARDTWHITTDWSPGAKVLEHVHAGLRALDDELHGAFRRAAEVAG